MRQSMAPVISPDRQRVTHPRIDTTLWSLKSNVVAIPMITYRQLRIGGGPRP